MTMKFFLKVIICLLFIDGINAQGIAVNEDASNPDASAILDIRSSEKGMLAPRMTTPQRESISSPTKGLIVFDTDEKVYFQYDGATWVDFEVTDRGTVSGNVPSSPSVGDKYYDETGGSLYVYTTGGWASIDEGAAVNSPYGTIDMVFGTASGNSITISSWNEEVNFDGYVILMNYENSFTDLATDEEVHASVHYANNGEQAVFDGTASTEVKLSVVAYESIYYFKMVPYTDGVSKVYDNSQASVFVTTASCTYASGTDNTTTFTSDNESTYETYRDAVESQVCFSYDLTSETFTMSSNQWPDHYMGDAGNLGHISGKFPVAYVVANEVTREIELNPTYNPGGDITYVYSEEGDTKSYDFYNFGIAINGVEFHPMGVEPWDVLAYNSGGELEETGEENWEWQLRVVFEDDVNLDPQGGHTTSRGEYHYHGDITAFVDEDGTSHSKIYGFAADGFPIYYKYGYTDANDPTSDIKELTSSYKLRSGARSTHPNVIASGGTAGLDYPDGNFDDDDDDDGIGGTYIQDYEYDASSGDLDECNGRYGVTPEYPEGTYYYVLTADFPITPNCFVGTPKDDFLIGN